MLVLKLLRCLVLCCSVPLHILQKKYVFDSKVMWWKTYPQQKVLLAISGTYIAARCWRPSSDPIKYVDKIKSVLSARLIVQVTVIMNCLCNHQNAVKWIVVLMPINLHCPNNIWIVDKQTLTVIQCDHMNYIFLDNMRWVTLSLSDSPQFIDALKF